MSVQAANPVAPPQLSLCAIKQATECLPARKGGYRQRSSYGAMARSRAAEMAGDFCSRNADENFAPCVSAGSYPAVCSVTASGPFMRPAATRSSASAAPSFGLRFPSKSCSGSAPKRFLRTLRKSRPSALGSMAHSPGSAQCDPSRIGKFNETETTSCTRTK
jgi:hypothetical protein